MQGASIPCWIDTENVSEISGNGLLQCVREGIRNSACVVICASDEYVGTPRCVLEGEYALLAHPNTLGDGAAAVVFAIVGERGGGNESKRMEEGMRNADRIDATSEGDGADSCVVGDHGNETYEQIGAGRRGRKASVNRKEDGKWMDGWLGAAGVGCMRVDFRAVDSEEAFWNSVVQLRQV